MIQHIYKVIHEKERRHGMPYEYFLNKVFDYFEVVWKKETLETMKQMFTLTMLFENECVKGKVGTMSQVSELLVILENLSREIKEMTVYMDTTDA